MAAVDALGRELDGIWLATIRAEWRRRVEVAVSVAAAIVTGCLVTVALC
jgi:hypothetical protein